jgi:1,2-diacylglycerol 3-beta-glucosyltransferase
MTLPGFVLGGMLFLLGIPAVFASLYLLAAALLSARPAAAHSSDRRRRFDVIVPAHNEEAGIARTVGNLRALDWPAEDFRILVIADNCSDATAANAAAAGATVIERQDANLRGKGYALNYAFERSLRDGWAEAVVVVDADSEASANLLNSIAARIGNGAHAVQVHYGVLNPNVAWRTRLMSIALGSFHIVRSRARERLRLSCGIRGNGWCVTHDLLARVPYHAYSLTEDIEYGVALGLQGERVHYADEGHVYGEMVTNSRSAASQRQRWEQGRFKLIRQHALALFRAAAGQSSRVCLDLGFDLLVLPLSYIALNIVALAVLAGLSAFVDAHLLQWLWVAAACAACVACYVLRGWWVSGVGWRGLPDLLWAPVFIVWKIFLAVAGSRATEWLRTERERP